MNFLHKVRKLKETYLTTLLVVLIAVLINVIIANRFVRIDLTKNQLYAVSDASQNIMRNLDDIVTVKVFFSDQLPPNLFAVRQYIRDLLDELGSYAKGNLNVQFLDPSIPEVQNEALALGIPQIQMNIVEKDKLEVKNGFLGIAIQYGDKTEILPVVQSILNAEYDLVASIKKVVAREERVVGFLTGHKEPSLDERIKVNGEGETLSQLRQALDRNYTVKKINFKNGGNLSNIDTLLIIGAKTPLSEVEKNAVDTFLDNGGNLVLLTDPFEVSGDLQINENEFNLDQVLASYGIRLDKELILDRSNERASFNQGFMSFVLPYPFWIKAVNEHFHESHPMVANLESVVFPWISPISINQQQGARVIKLIETTENAWKNEPPFQLEPNLVQSSKTKNQYLLAAIGEKISNQKAGKVLVVGNARFITDRFVRMYSQNLPFAMNAIDFLTLDESLIGIRSKNAFDLPLKELNIGERNIVKFIGIVLIPVLVILFGIARFFIRRRLLNNIHWEK